MKTLELRKILAVLMLSLIAAMILPACSSTAEEEAEDEVCDEMDAGAQDCDDLIR
jgi:hypothetical protein